MRVAAEEAAGKAKTRIRAIFSGAAAPRQSDVLIIPTQYMLKFSLPSSQTWEKARQGYPSVRGVWHNIIVVIIIILISKQCKNSPFL